MSSCCCPLHVRLQVVKMNGKNAVASGGEGAAPQGYRGTRSFLPPVFVVVARNDSKADTHIVCRMIVQLFLSLILISLFCDSLTMSMCLFCFSLLFLFLLVSTIRMMITRSPLVITISASRISVACTQSMTMTVFSGYTSTTISSFPTHAPQSSSQYRDSASPGPFVSPLISSSNSARYA